MSTWALTEDERVEALNDASYRAYAAMRRADRAEYDADSVRPREDAKAWALIADALKRS